MDWEEAPRFVPCHRCEKGTMVPVQGDRRLVWWDGLMREVPRGMFVRTCTACGEFLFDDEERTFLAGLWS